MNKLRIKDIRDRDINARALYDPRYDKRPKQTQVQPQPQAPVQAAPQPQSQPQSQPQPKPNRTPTIQQQPPQQPPQQPQPQRLSIQPFQPPQQQLSIQPRQPQPQPAAPARTIVTGDSVATGIGYGGAKGTPESEAHWGRSSAQQLAYMRRKGPNYYRGADVVLSSGVLNSGDLASVEAQLQFLRQANVRSVRLAGGPLGGIHSRHNAALKALAEKYGFTFMGGYDSDDGVHPRSYQNYR